MNETLNCVSNIVRDTMIPGRPSRADSLPPFIHGLAAAMWFVLALLLVLMAAAIAANGLLIYAGTNTMLALLALYLARRAWRDFTRGVN